jgi:hypothetical protein
MLDVILSAITVAAAAAGLPRFLKLKQFEPADDIHRQWAELELRSLKTLLIGGGAVLGFQIIATLVVVSVFAGTRDPGSAIVVGLVVGAINLVVLIAILVHAGSCGSKAKKLLGDAKPPVAVSPFIRVPIFMAVYIAYMIGIQYIMRTF